MASALLDPIFDAAGLGALFSDSARLQAMLDFEAALARAEAQCGMFDAAEAECIARCCRAEGFDVESLGRAARAGGNPAIPLVAALTERVAAESSQAARWVHFGATSQDVIDTALVLALRQLGRILDRQLTDLAATLADLAAAHRDTPMVARTFLQHAVPTTFGCKVAGWLDSLLRHRQRLGQLEERLLVLQFGGAAGTLGALGEKGPQVASRLAGMLGLGLPEIPWHVHRDRLAELGGWLGSLAGCLGKIAQDVALMTQSEVAEVAEGAKAGHGTSSSMPQKRNPVACVLTLAAARRAPHLAATLFASMLQEQERGLGGWHAEWQTVAELCVLVGGALHLMGEALGGLEVDVARMRRNLDLSGGLVMAEAVQTALVERIGRADAREKIAAACQRARAEGRHLREVLAADAEIGASLDRSALERLFDPDRHLGAAPAFVDAVLARYRASRSRDRDPA